MNSRLLRASLYQVNPKIKLDKPSIETLKNTSKSSISVVKKEVLSGLHNAFNVKKDRITRRNLSKKSYFYRFILRRKSVICKRTLESSLRPFVTYQIEKEIYESFRKSKRKRYLIIYKSFNPGIVYVTHRRRNTFITIYKTEDDDYNHIVFKASVGLTGYIGPKRSTNLGKEQVGLLANSFLRENEFTSVDLIFTRRVGRWFSFTIKGLFHKPVQVRHICIPKRRSHGYTRLKKIRRI